MQAVSDEDVMERPTGDFGADARKTLALAKANLNASGDHVLVTDADSAKAVLRSQCVKQAGFTAEVEGLPDFGRKPTIILDGPEHRRLRGATARFFAPKVVTTRYLDLMEKTAARLVKRVRQAGRADLGELSMELATAVAGEIVGLTCRSPRGMADRLIKLMACGENRPTSKIGLLIRTLETIYRFKSFEYLDVRPAIRERRKMRREDVMSHLLDENYTVMDVLSECMSYAAAGMVTTKEFIVVAFWHLMEDETLRARFLASERKDQALMLEEILRLEPIIGMLSRRATEEIELPGDRRMPAGTLFRIDVRDANVDESAVGACPHQIDPERAVAKRAGGSMFSFGDGVHRCPGHQVAMYESAVFLEHLFKLPGLKIASKPTMSWVQMLVGYEIHDMIITCDRA